MLLSFPFVSTKFLGLVSQIQTVRLKMKNSRIWAWYRKGETSSAGLVVLSTATHLVVQLHKGQTAQKSLFILVSESASLKLYISLVVKWIFLFIFSRPLYVRTPVKLLTPMNICWIEGEIKYWERHWRTQKHIVPLVCLFNVPGKWCLEYIMKLKYVLVNIKIKLSKYYMG